MPDDNGADARQQARVEVYGIAGVAPLKCEPREDRVKCVADSGTDTEQKSPARDTDAAHKARDEAAAQKSRYDRNYLDRRQLLFKEHSRQQCNHDRSYVKKYRRSGQAHHGDGGKVAVCKEQEAQKSGAQKAPEVLGLNLKG